MNPEKNILPQAIVFFIGITSIVTVLAAIIFIAVGWWLSQSDDEIPSHFISIAGIALLISGICFSMALLLFKKKHATAIKLAITASAILSIILIISAISMINISPGWKFSTVAILLSLLTTGPFIWLIFYLWKFEK